MRAKGVIHMPNMCAADFQRFREELVRAIERQAQRTGLHVWVLHPRPGCETISVDTAPYGPDTPQNEQIAIAITPTGIGYSILKTGWEWFHVNSPTIEAAEGIAKLVFAEYEQVATRPGNHKDLEAPCFERSQRVRHSL